MEFDDGYERVRAQESESEAAAMSHGGAEPDEYEAQVQIGAALSLLGGSMPRFLRAVAEVVELRERWAADEAARIAAGAAPEEPF